MPRTTESNYIHQTLALLDGAADHEAVNLLADSGFLGTAEGGGVELDNAIVRLADPKPTKALEQWNHKHYPTNHGDCPFVGDDMERAFNAKSDLYLDERMATNEAAYLLGIAVGRRLGSAPLSIKRNGGGR